MTRSLRRVCRRRWRVVCAALLWAAGAVPPGAGAPPEAGLVYAAEVDALIQPVTARYMVDAIRRADVDRASLLIFTLRTPGGLLDSTREINSAIMAARTPIVVWVGPAGARAASAGFLITLAADVAAMAPGTHIGAAHPVSVGPEQVSETMAKKAAQDVAADARALATRRGRNIKLAEAAVLESRSFTEKEALDADPPLIDLIAPSLPELLKELDGERVVRFDGSSVVLETTNARVVPIEMSWRQRFLSAIAHPNIAFILLSLGTLGLSIELWNPGAILPGVVGGLALLLAFFALGVLPVNSVGLLLILFGLLLLVLEVKITSYGLLSVGGIASLLVGSMMLIDSDAPEMQVSLRVILPVVAALSTILLFLVQMAVKSQQRRAVTGDAGMMNEVGVAVTSIVPGAIGRVRVHGEIWNATSPEPIAQGDRIRIRAVDGLTLTVTRVSDGESRVSSS